MTKRQLRHSLQHQHYAAQNILLGTVTESSTDPPAVPPALPTTHPLTIN